MYLPSRQNILSHEIPKIVGNFEGITRPNFSHFWGPKKSSIEAWGSQTTSIEASESETQHKNNCFSVKAKFKLFFRHTSLHQNVKHLVGHLYHYFGYE